ncbi:hypothetical protein [Haladaptatus caseinilyticus]|uniref:hypothetical protein n=1 Tax=Haladaptatus caseinilyticus TaxID=2993314 RepID=UPI00224B38C9|nr:hypothetical protein [Haladaptatus caseinilyticus]
MPVETNNDANPAPHVPPRTRRFALVFTGIAIATASLVVYELGRRVSIEHALETLERYQ